MASECRSAVGDLLEHQDVIVRQDLGVADAVGRVVGPAYGAPCNWQTRNPSATLVANSAESDLGRSPFDNAQFKLSRPDRFEAVYTSGTAQPAVPLRR